MVLHPLFGYTFNPKLDGVNNFGFMTEHDFALKNNRYVLADAADRQRLVVGVFGGSFAQGVGGRGGYFAKKLADVFPDKQVVIVNMAIGGQAIPQSAFIYLYFRDLFDVAVFVDGLNELWNYTQNNRDGAPPEYAKATHYRYKLSKEELSPATFALTSQLIEAESKLQAWTAFSLRPVVRDSVLVHYLWQQRAAVLSQKVGEISLRISQQFQGGERFFPNPDAEVLAFAARQWQAYHELVHRTATAQGTLSLHILQPNPFVPESKPLTPTEQKLIHQSFPVQSFVEEGYPLLRQGVRKLLAQNVAATDLTHVYRANTDEIWIDSAHANTRGYELVINRIVAKIREATESGAWKLREISE